MRAVRELIHGFVQNCVGRSMRSLDIGSGVCDDYFTAMTSGSASSDHDWVCSPNEPAETQ